MECSRSEFEEFYAEFVTKQGTLTATTASAAASGIGITHIYSTGLSISSSGHLDRVRGVFDAIVNCGVSDIDEGIYDGLPHLDVPVFTKGVSKKGVDRRAFELAMPDALNTLHAWLMSGKRVLLFCHTGGDAAACLAVATLLLCFIADEEKGDESGLRLSPNVGEFNQHSKSDVSRTLQVS